MHKFIFLCALHVFVFCDAASQYNSEWDAFKIQYGKQYSSPDVESYHRKNFVNNLNTILQHNNEDKSYKLGINQFSDLNNKDFAAKHLSIQSLPNKLKSHTLFNIKSIPESLDWRNAGAIRPVVSQGMIDYNVIINSLDCLSAYQVIQLNHSLIALSQQQIYDCLRYENKTFCDVPGLVNSLDIFDYVTKAQGIESDEEYPKTKGCNKCKYDPTKSVAYDNGWSFYRGGNETYLENLLQKGPAVVGVFAAVDSFMMYRNGIYSDSACVQQPIDHLMLLVGYGKETLPTGEANEYWILRNTWGVSWGEQGYMRIARNKGNLCGVASWATVPIVNHNL